MKAQKQGAHGVHQVFLERVARAVELLGGKNLNDARVHAARKEIKKARATLRLLRDVLSETVYRRENAELRDSARPLGVARDARVLFERLSEIVQSSTAPRRVNLGKFRRLLRAERAKSLGGFSIATRDRTCATLHECHARGSRWNVEQGWASISAGLKRTYRRGRHALATAGDRRLDEDLHEWRKQATYLWRQLELLDPVTPRSFRKRANRMHELADLLGEDHDLFVLRSAVAAHRTAFADERDVAWLTRSIDRRRRVVQRKAFSLGRKAFDLRPREFRKRLERGLPDPHGARRQGH